MNSYHPSDKTKNNASLILEELADLEYAISKAKPDLIAFAGPGRDADKTIADIRKSIQEKNRTFDVFHKPGQLPKNSERSAKRKYPSPRKHKT